MCRETIKRLADCQRGSRPSKLTKTALEFLREQLATPCYFCNDTGEVDGHRCYYIRHEWLERMTRQLVGGVE